MSDKCRVGADDSTFRSIGENSSTDSYVSFEHIGKAFLEGKRESTWYKVK